MTSRASNLQDYTQFQRSFVLTKKINDTDACSSAIGSVYHRFVSNCSKRANLFFKGMSWYNIFFKGTWNQEIKQKTWLRGINLAKRRMSDSWRRIQIDCKRTFFLTRPRFFSYFDVSMEVARRRADLPGLASGLIIHQEDFPVPSFWTRMKRLCSDKLWRIEFWFKKRKENYY